MIVDPGALEAQYVELMNRRDYNAILTLARHEISVIATDAKHIGHSLFLPMLDEMMHGIGKALHKPPARAADENIVMHVATEVETTGGHARVIEDIVRALPEKRHILVLTDALHNYVAGRLSPQPLLERYETIGLDLMILHCEPPLVKAATDLVSYISRTAPYTLMLHTHSFDVIAHASITSDSAPNVLFFHNMDYRPALGATRKDFVHIDMTPLCHVACRQAGFAKTPHFIGLTLKDRGYVKAPKPGPLTGVTCASYDKYIGGKKFKYPALVAAFFANGLQKLIHIGTMPEEMQKKIRKDIRRNGQDDEKMVFHPSVPSVADAIKEISPHFFLCSYPLGSGKTMIEAISTGVPILMPREEATPPLVNADMSFGNALTIKDLSEIPAAMKRLTAEGSALGARNRAIYEEYYSMVAYRHKLLELIGKISLAEPAPLLDA